MFTEGLRKGVEQPAAQRPFFGPGMFGLQLGIGSGEKRLEEMNQIWFGSKSGDFDQSCAGALVQIVEPLNLLESQMGRVSFSIRVRILSNSSQVVRSRSMNFFKSTIIRVCRRFRSI